MRPYQQDSGATVAGDAELAELRLRVAAQDRLIAAIIEENEDIHQLRRRNADLERRFHMIRSVLPVRLLRAVRSRLRPADPRP